PSSWPPPSACSSSFFFQAEDGIRDFHVTGVQTCALPIFLAVTVEDLPAGDWQVRLDLYDDAGDITHTAAGTVRVRPGETAAPRLEPQPAGGFFEILADAGCFSRRDQVERARVVLHNNQTSTLEPVPGEPLVFHGRKALKPGDYDFRVELYGATLYAADRLYQSPWESVRIHPGKTSRVTWEVAAGIAH